MQSAEIAEVWRTFTQNGMVRFSRSDVIANFWLGFPMAFALCGVNQLHKGSKARRLFLSVLVLLAQFAVSMIAELGQGWAVNRVPSLSDLALQLAGAFFVIAIWHCTGRWIESKTDSVFGYVASRQESNRLDAVLALVAVGILVWTVFPLDIIVSPAELVKESLKTELVPFTRFEATASENVYQWLASVLLAVPLGLWLSRWLAKRFSGRLSFLSLSMLAIGIGVLPEICQFPIDSRVASATDALFGAIGALIGILIGSRFRSTRYQLAKAGFWGVLRTPGFWLVLAIVQATTICAIAWMPFDFSTDPSEVAERFKRLRANPFSGYRGSDLLRGLTLLRQIVLAAGLGIFLGFAQHYLDLKRTPSVIGSAIIVMLVFVFSIGVEFGQVLIDSRTGESVGVFVRTSGSVLGLVATLNFLNRLKTADL